MRKLLLLSFCLCVGVSYAAKNPIEADTFFVFIAQSGRGPGPELFEFLSQARPQRLKKMMESERGRWNFEGSLTLRAELKEALQAEVIHAKFPWKALVADCRQEIRAQYPGESDKGLEFLFRLCDAENVKKAQWDLNGEVNLFQSRVENRDRYILVLNRISQQIHSQLPVINDLKTMVASVGDCAPTSEARIVACLTVDAKFRQGVASLLADTQMMMDALISVPKINSIPAAKELGKMLDLHRREYIRILKEQLTHKIQGVIAE